MTNWLQLKTDDAMCPFCDLESPGQLIHQPIAKAELFYDTGAKTLDGMPWGAEYPGLSPLGGSWLYGAMKGRDRVVVIAGPTASGKSALAIELANRLLGSCP